jgi:serine/threonine protein kinase
VWSFGVIARELLTGRNPSLLIPDQKDPLLYASLMRGRITNAVWPDVESAPFYKKPHWHFEPDDWKAKEFGRVDDMSLDFVRSMLQADPTRRPTAADVVASTFWVAPVRQYVSNGDVRKEGLPHSGMPSSTLSTLTTKMSGASHVAANDGEVGASHSAQMLESPTKPNQAGIGADLDGPRCQCHGPWSCGSFKHCQGPRREKSSSSVLAADSWRTLLALCVQILRESPAQITCLLQASMEVGYHRVQVRQSVRPELDPHGP